MADERIELLTRTATPLATSLGLDIWGVEFVGNTRPVVRLYVEAAPADATNQAELAPQADPAAKAENAVDPAKLSTEFSAELPGGVSVDECAHLSRLLGLALEVEDIFSSGWVLEVSSPGLERPFFRIDQLLPYVGREIDFTLTMGLDEWSGRKHFHGILAAVADGTLTLNLAPADHKEDEPDDITVAWSQVRKAHLVHRFADSSRTKRKKSGAAKDASGGIA